MNLRAIPLALAVVACVSPPSDDPPMESGQTSTGETDPTPGTDTDPNGDESNDDGVSKTDTDPDPDTDGPTSDTDDPTSDTDDPTSDTDDPTSDTDIDIDESMSFFVTSEGNGDAGGNYGGLAGADARCQSLAEAVGAGDRTWRAYLSTAPSFDGGELVHARDRIGSGPWFNAAGELVANDVDELHSDGLASSLMLTEQGGTVPDDEHDILTGTDADGMALAFFPGNPSSPPPTCFNWTANDANAWVWVGHTDGTGSEWVDVHGTSCDPAGLAATAGSGRLYCFAE